MSSLFNEQILDEKGRKGERIPAEIHYFLQMRKQEQENHYKEQGLEAYINWKKQSKNNTSKDQKSTSKNSIKVVRTRGASIACEKTLEYFYEYLFAFSTLLGSLPSDSEKKLQEAHEKVKQYYFSENRSSDEWLLEYLDAFLLNHEKSSFVLSQMFQDGLFVRLKVLVKPPSESEKEYNETISLGMFEDLELSLDETPLRSKLRELFQMLDMCQVTQRKSLNAFTEKLKSFESVLKASCYFYLEDSLKSISMWEGSWFIFSVWMFIEDLIGCYFKKLNVKAEDYFDAHFDESIADTIFVCTLYHLFSGECTSWSKITDIKFHTMENEIKNVTVTFPPTQKRKQENLNAEYDPDSLYEEYDDEDF